MESNKLTTIDNQLPLRAYPEKKLDEVLETEFKFWLCNLLSIKADNEDKLDAALPAIKKHFWSLGFHEIKKAFEMYADGELNVKPISNYFDRVLVGHIFTTYKQQRVVKTTQTLDSGVQLPPSKETMRESILLSFDEYIEKGYIQKSYAVGFDRLYEWKVLPQKGKSKKADKKYQDLLKLAHAKIVAPIQQKVEWIKSQELEDTQEGKEYLDYLKALESSYNHPEVQNRFKRLILEGFFSKITKDELIELINK